MSMDVLLVGDNAIAHALADKVARSARLFSVLRRENPGIERLSEAVLKQSRPNPREIVEFAKANGVEYAVILSRTFLNAAVADRLLSEGIATIGPSREAAQMESDKLFALAMMKELGFKRPRTIVASTLAELKEAIIKIPSFVLKPSYYTMGRGTRYSSPSFGAVEGEAYGKEIFSKGGKVIVEEQMEGSAFTVMGFTDGKDVSISPPVAVLKRLRGAASQGYASFSTGEELPFLSKEDVALARGMMEKLVSFLAARGWSFKGAFGLELMKVQSGIISTGFSSTFSDPAALNVLPLMKTEMFALLEQMWNEQLKGVEFKVLPNVVKYLFPEGYPSRPRRIALNIDENCLWKKGLKYFLQGVVVRDGHLYTTSSRTLAVFASGNSLEEAEERVDSSRECVPGLSLAESVVKDFKPNLA